MRCTWKCRLIREFPKNNRKRKRKRKRQQRKTRSAEGKTQLEQGLFSIFIDPQQLETSDYFLPEVKRYVDFVRSARPKQTSGEVLVPGQIEARNRRQRLQDGIELDEQTWQQLIEAGQSVGMQAGEFAAD